MELHVRLIFCNRNVALLKYVFHTIQQKYTTQIILFCIVQYFFFFLLYSSLFTISELFSSLHKDHFVLFHLIELLLFSSSSQM